MLSPSAKLTASSASRAATCKSLYSVNAIWYSLDFTAAIALAATAAASAAAFASPLFEATVGTPLMSPVEEDRVNPAGRLLALNVIGAVPLAVTVLLNGTPTCPRKELVEVMTGVAGRLGLVSAVI